MRSRARKRRKQRDGGGCGVCVYVCLYKASTTTTAAAAAAAELEKQNRNRMRLCVATVRSFGLQFRFIRWATRTSSARITFREPHNHFTSTPEIRVCRKRSTIHTQFNIYTTTSSSAEITCTRIYYNILHASTHTQTTHIAHIIDSRASYRHTHAPQHHHRE